MSQAIMPHLAVPELEHIGRDLVVVLPDGSQAERLRNYFPDVTPAQIQEMLQAINRQVGLTHHENGDIWARGTDGPDVMLCTNVARGEDVPLFVDAGAGNDVIIAGAGRYSLDGGPGNDYLIGGGGGDVLYGDSGCDILYSASGNNHFYGGPGNDILLGGTGSDQMYGGPGDDRLIGNGGDDTYFFEAGGGHDRLFNRDEAGDDALCMIEVAADQLWFARQGNDLEVRRIDTGEGVTLQHWFDRPTQRVDTIEVFSPSGDHANQRLAKEHVDSLVQAMAAFAPPAPGATVLPAEYQAALAPVIAASWT